MPIKPPKCKTCGKEEFRHICSGLPAARDRVKQIEAQVVTPSEKGKAKAAKRRKGKKK